MSPTEFENQYYLWLAIVWIICGNSKITRKKTALVCGHGAAKSYLFFDEKNMV